MSRFSLSVVREKTLPCEVYREDGSRVPIDADFRTVLKCLRVLKDPDAEQKDQMFLLLRWFFKGEFVPDGLKLFGEFLAVDRDDGGDSLDDEPVMDFEQDADAIYASFLMDYGLDLLTVEFLHWRQFKALLRCLSDRTALRRRIAIRTMDTSKLEGQARDDAERAKRAVQLKVQIGTEEKRLQEELDSVLAAGGDPTEALAALRDFYSRQG